MPSRKASGTIISSCGANTCTDDRIFRQQNRRVQIGLRDNLLTGGNAGRRQRLIFAFQHAAHHALYTHHFRHVGNFERIVQAAGKPAVLIRSQADIDSSLKTSYVPNAASSAIMSVSTLAGNKFQAFEVAHNRLLDEFDPASPYLRTCGLSAPLLSVSSPG